MNGEKASGVTKAVVLAAGYGTRLRPFTDSVPKPLMPVRGEPMLARIVGLLRGAGVEEIFVNCHHLYGQVAAWCAANDCRVSYEKEILGTGGVLNPLRRWIGSEPFYLVNGDIVVENAAIDRLRSALADDTVAAVTVTREGPRTIEVEDGVVTNWKSGRRGSDGTYTYAGIALISPRILDYVKGDGFSTIIEAYEKAAADGLKVRAVELPEMEWTDAGTIRSYLSVNEGHLAETGFEFLGARGSERAFYRAGDALIVLYEDARRGENARYVGHANWLKSHGISVPAVLADYPSLKTSVFEFAGEEAMMNEADYGLVIDELVRFGALGAEAAIELDLEPRFDRALWKWERDLFAKYCLKANFGIDLPAETLAEYERVADRLEQEPRALVHRDFQSTNVLWKDGQPVFIDFQGMRLGPAAYDIASLVYDPYVRFPEKTRARLIARYAAKCGRPAIAEAVPVAAVQRLTQCLGAYGRLASVGQPQFWKHVPAALDNLETAATQAGLSAIAALASRLIALTSHLAPRNP